MDGMVITNDPEVFGRANGVSIATIPMVQARRRAFGVEVEEWEADEWYRYPSTNRRMSRLHAAIGLAQLAHLEEQTQRRADNAKHLATLLEDIGGLTARREDAFVTRNSNHLFVARYNASEFGGLPRQRFLEALRAEGVPCSSGYPLGMHRAEVFLNPEGELRHIWPREGSVDVDYRAMHCPIADRACAEEAVWIPGPVLLDTPEGMEQIATAVERIKSGVGKLTRQA